MYVASIDPGSATSALAVMKRLPDNGATLARHLTQKNEDVVDSIKKLLADPLVDRIVIEQLTPYGKRVGREVFDTIYWSGRFHEAAGWKGCLISRKCVCATLTGSARNGDGHVRRVVIDRLNGGVSKLADGPLAGVVRDEWQAIGVGLAWLSIFGRSLPDARKWGAR